MRAIILLVILSGLPRVCVGQYLTPRAIVPSPLTAEGRTGDFNGDGRPDLLRIAQPMNGVIGYPGELQFSLGPPVPILLATTIPPGATLPAQFRTFAVLNVNGDAFDDLVLIDAAGRLLTYLGAGTGVFNPVTGSVTLSPSAEHELTVGDVDTDGDDDVALTDGPSQGSAQRIRVLRNDPGGWIESDQLLVADGVEFLAFADVDGDGRLDLAHQQTGAGAGWRSQRYLVARYGLGTGAFAAPRRFLLGLLRPSGLIGAQLVPHAFGDCDRDGQDELLFSRPRVLAGQPVGHEIFVAFFPTATRGLILSRVGIERAAAPSTGIGLLGPGWGDVDGDGFLDVLYQVIPYNPWPALSPIATHEYAGGQRFLRGANDLRAPLATQLLLSDLNADGDADVIHVAGNTITWYENTAWSPLGCPSLLGNQPALTTSAARRGMPLTITVSNAAPQAPLVVGVAPAPAPAPPLPACGPGLAAGNVVVLGGPGPAAALTDATGRWSATLVLPAVPQLGGRSLWIQSLIADPQGSFLAQGLRFTLTHRRQLIVR